MFMWLTIFSFMSDSKFHLAWDEIFINIEIFVNYSNNDNYIIANQ